MMTDEQIKRYEDAGFSRWTKRDMDRLYIDTTKLGLDCQYKRDHEPCLGDWQSLCARARRLTRSSFAAYTTRW